MKQNRWIIERAGLINFWYYDEEEFNFSDGRLLLRGANGSGKSVTMQSFIPLLLDGNKSPERLDPFGSKARRIENYLLGDEESELEERTSYLYMEFKKKESGNYITIGMGFKAQRGKPIQSWGFAITDGRRIGHNFFLYKDIGDKVPLSKKELENRIGSGGRVVEAQKDYMKMVNDLLFGYEDIDDYDELIKLLVQLRSPKLSKEFRPTVIYEILENSLQPLSDDDLRPMSEAIENMDNIKIRLDELKESKKAAEKIKDVYDKYNRFMLLDKAKNLINIYNEYQKLLKNKQELEGSKENSKKEFETASKNIEELKIKQAFYENKKRQLEVHDSLKIKEKIKEVEDFIESLKKQKHEKISQEETKRQRERQLQFELNKLKDNKEILLKKVEDIILQMDDLYLEFDFDEQVFLKDELKNNIEVEYNFSFVKEKLSKHIKNLEEAKEGIEELERINKLYDEALKVLERAKQEKDYKEKKLNEAKLLLEEIKEELIEKIYKWHKENNELILSDETLVKISQVINNFNKDSSFDEVIVLLRDEFNKVESLLNSQILKLKFQKESLEEKIKELNEKIAEWKNKKDPEPERKEAVIKNRERLKKENIPFIPFYKAVDFVDGLSEEIKSYIESALCDMGVLDALIVPKQYKEKIFEMDKDMADKYIFPSPAYLMHDLTQFLKVDKIDVDGIKEEDIVNSLKSIMIDEGSATYLNEKGEYSIGILKGKTNITEGVKFIGSSARKRYREIIIKDLEEQKSQLEREIQTIKEELEMIYQKLEILKKELNSFPRPDDLKIAINTVTAAEFELEKAIEDISIKEKEEIKIFERLKEIKQRVYELTNKINLKADLDTFKSALEASREYRELLYELENSHRKFLQNKENLKAAEENLKLIQEDIEIIIYDLNSIKLKLKEQELLLDSLKEQLKISNYEEIKNEIEDCIKNLREIPSLIEKEVEKRAKEEERYTKAIKELEEIDNKIKRKEILFNLHQDAFKEEYALGFIETPKDEDTIKLAQRIIKEIKQEDKQREDYINSLYSKFNENSPYLREYILKMDTIFEKNIDTEDEDIKEALSKTKRLAIRGKVRGREVDLYDLLEFIEEGINENENLLRESDRQLFEDILVNNISKKIRSKIYHAQEWVKKMNKLMESMDTSSGLSFSLRWSSKKAEGENQLDTNELVELLRQEGSIMKIEDLNKLSQHFRAKINEARRIQEELGKAKSFHSIIKEILDYRKWFEFKLYYKRSGQNPKELTNNAFYQFSGGEKAMAMYVPLFSAVYARYEGARMDCPRIISLDEAFAGVDERNIRDMFRLLTELELDFIVNSQILWGDYDTVPSLSICELIRQDNADFVTVIRYHWNGKVKEFVC